MSVAESILRNNPALQSDYLTAARKYIDIQLAKAEEKFINMIAEIYPGATEDDKFSIACGYIFKNNDKIGIVKREWIGNRYDLIFIPFPFYK